MSTPAGKIYFLSLGRQSRVMSVNDDGSDPQVLVDGLESKPDGIAIDAARGRMYYTFMGVIRDGEDFWGNDGYIESANLDGSDRKVLVPEGSFVTGKQIQYDKASDRIYWCDREGMRLMSARADGSDLTVHMQTGTTEAEAQDRRNHFVGVAVDPHGGYIYFTLKGKPNGNEGRIMRVPIKAAPGITPTNRTDAELLFDGLPEPIDLEWVEAEKTLYWTDRGDPPKGNTLNRAVIRDGKPENHEILLSNLEEAIGLAVDHAGRRAFISDQAGKLTIVDLDNPGTGQVIYKRGLLTGIAYLKN